MASAAMQRVGAVGATATATVVGAALAGPLGAAVGMAAGAGIDFLRARAKTKAATSKADLDAASKVVGLLVAAANPTGPHIVVHGHEATAEETMTAPAAMWLKKFQASVNLAQTGQLDPSTRAALIAAVPTAASSLPAVTLLG